MSIARIRALAIVVAVLAASALVTACGANNEASDKKGASDTRGAGGGDRPTFYGVIHGSPGADPYWALFFKGAKTAAKQENVNLKLLGTPKFSVQAWADLVNSAIAAKPNGLLMTFPSPEAVDAPVRQAIEKGLPVIAWDTNDSRPAAKRLPYLAYVGVDYVKIGVLAAQRSLKDSKPKRAVCAIHEVGQLGLEQTCQGFTRVMKAAGVPVDKIEISAADPTKAAEQARGYLTSHSDADLIFTQGPPPAEAVSKVLEEQKLGDKVHHITGVLTAQNVKLLEQGKLVAVIDQAPFLQGYMAVTMMNLRVRYNLLPNNPAMTAESVVDRSNMVAVAQLAEEGLR
jgi:simple sugar transport system substrate-binding protein